MALIVLGATACADREPARPQIKQVQPAEGRTDTLTPITILGTFHPLLKADYDDEAEAVVSLAFSARLGQTALTDVRFINSTRLTAVVPTGLAVGIYDLTLTDPRGRQATLVDAFTIKPPGLDAGPDLSPPTDAGPDQRVDAPADQALTDSVVDTVKPDSAPDTQPGPTVSTVAGSGTKGFLDGTSAAAQFYNPIGVAVFGATIYVGDFANHRIRSITGGAVKTFAGSGQQGKLNGAAAAAQFNFPAGLALSADGKTLYVADSANDMIRVVAGGVVSTLAGSGIKGFLNGAAASARFNFPRGLTADGATLYVADTENHRIRVISGGTVSTLAGSGTKGYLDGPVASARFSSPHGVAVVGSTLYVADSENNRIRVISGGTVSTLAGVGTAGAIDGPAASARFWNPVGLVVAGGGKLHVVDQSNHRVRTIDKGVVTTLAGSYFGFKDGPAKGALFYYPHGLAIGGAGELYVADQSNHRLRMISF